MGIQWKLQLLNRLLDHFVNKVSWVVCQRKSKLHTSNIRVRPYYQYCHKSKQVLSMASQSRNAERVVQVDSWIFIICKWKQGKKGFQQRDYHYYLPVTHSTSFLLQYTSYYSSLVMPPWAPEYLSAPHSSAHFKENSSFPHVFRWPHAPS